MFVYVHYTSAVTVLYSRARSCVCVCPIQVWHVYFKTTGYHLQPATVCRSQLPACVACHAARESTLQLNFRRPFQISRVSVAAEPKRARIATARSSAGTSTGTGFELFDDSAGTGADRIEFACEGDYDELLSPFGEASENPGENCTPFRAFVSERMSSGYLQTSIDDPSATRF